MIQRWEEPDKNRKWESPLFPILDEETIPEDEFVNAIDGVGMTHHQSTTTEFIIISAPSKLSRSTSNPPLKSTDFLQELDKKIKEIMKSVLDKQKEMGGATGVLINHENQQNYFNILV